MDQKDIENFRQLYRADISQSQKQYMRSSYPAFSAGNSLDQIQTQIENGVDITMMQSRFERLVQDAEAGREFRVMRSRHPGVLEAWDRYRMMLILAFADEGRDPP